MQSKPLINLLAMFVWLFVNKKVGSLFQSVYYILEFDWTINITFIACQFLVSYQIPVFMKQTETLPTLFLQISSQTHQVS